MPYQSIEWNKDRNVKLGKKKIIFSVTILLALLIGGAIFFYKSKDESFVAPKRSNVVDAIYGLGKVKTRRKYEVKVGAMSKIEKVFVEEGQKVSKGDDLIKFSDFRVIRAPYAGTVTNLNYREPENVFPNVAVLVVSDLSNRYVEVSLEQEGALQTKVGQVASVLFESIRDIKYQGEVESIFPKDDEFLVHIDVKELRANILPGMTADVTINVATHTDALLIPLEGVSQGKAIIQRDGKEMKVDVSIGAVEGEWGQVIGGDIRSGDLVLANKKD